MEFLSSLLPAHVAEHAPALVVVAPLLMAAVAAIMPNGRLGWGVALLTTAVSAVLAVAIVVEVQTGGVISYAMGGWQPPAGIEFRIDNLNAVLLLLIAALGLLSTIYALPSVADEIAENRQALFYSAFLVCFAGLLGVAITGDAFNMFVFLEISSISTYVLVGMGAGNDRRALTAAYNYLILGTIGATFFVIGVGFLYMATGTLNMADMAERLPDMSDNRVVQAAFAFIIVGLGLKAAMFPLHLWLPNAYAYAPNFVTSFLATTATKVAFYTLVRFLFDVFWPDAPFVQVSFLWVFAVLGIIGMIVASVQAVFQDDARRLLAFSSVAQVGYMMLGLGIGTAAGVSAGMLHLVNHALMKGALFMALGAFAIRFGVRRISDLNGFARSMPFTSVAFTIAGLSLVGVPMTIGFWSKWYLGVAAFENGWWWAVAALILSSLIALAYVARMLAAIWVAEPHHDRSGGIASARAPWLMLVPMWILAFANIWFFFQPDFLVSLTNAAAEAALNGASQ
ncbi:monovalent cation/H+ antiporter subunit D family protein [Hyphobacterium sp. HN65]|uniref:Monovalent cation/H+ antiporter subunit D family protein n=1 Tax=Hyphobacterium lacteum TaxID=3116575 RepID=A0ABU7LT00_9PROT|nr:monovalent cation/H+ antiporter subunit D family protein [Hyphobacterium sp. HN65]MEE2527033.1 monovalent cation/H+ antiporter subunit D family protein [Hyphobacterium sp. HN65]